MSAEQVDLSTIVLPWEEQPPSPIRPAGPVAPPAVSGASSSYATGALVRECEAVAGTSVGGRNHRLNVASFSLGQLVGGGELAEDDARQGLLDAAQASGLGTIEASRTVTSGLAAGAREPRGAPPAKGITSSLRGSHTTREPLKGQNTEEGPETPVNTGVSLRGSHPPEDPLRGLRGSPPVCDPLRTTSPASGVVRLNSVTPESVDYLWPGRFPIGKLVILDGDPGVGKSTVALDIAARVSSGADMPDGAPGPGARGVVLLSAEDGLADTVRPRLDAAGANLARIVAIVDVPGYDDRGRQTSRPVVIPDDLDLIESAVRDVGAALLVVDVLMAYLSGDVNSYRDQDVRRVLHQLSSLAERTGCTVLMLRHLTKGSSGASPLYRGGGSIGITGASRAAFVAAPDPDDDSRCAFASMKMNLAAKAPTLGYRLVSAGDVARVEWLGTVEHQAADLLRPPGDESGSDRSEAVDFLRDALEFEPLPAKVVQARARDVGISPMTLKRAKGQLGVESVKAGFGDAGRWVWTLPGDAQTSTPEGES